MNYVIKNIITRRSVRAFSKKSISNEDLEAIVTAARYAPSGMNRQPCRFTVVSNKMAINKLAKVIALQSSRDGNYDFYKPDVLIITSCAESERLAIEDCACAMENIFLAAHSLGIGSVWINQLKNICDDTSIREVLTTLNIPKNHLVWGMAALGYPENPLPENTENTEKAENVEWIF